MGESSTIVSAYTVHSIGTYNTEFQIYSVPTPLTHDFKIWRTTFQGNDFNKLLKIHLI